MDDLRSDSILSLIKQQQEALQKEKMKILDKIEMMYMNRMNELIIQKLLIIKQTHKMYDYQLENMQNIITHRIQHIQQNINHQTLNNKKRKSFNNNNNNDNINEPPKYKIKLNDGSAIKVSTNTSQKPRFFGATSPIIMSLEKASKLSVDDKIDHRDKFGKFANAKIVEKNGSNLKIHYLYHSKQYDVWIDYKTESEIYRFASFDSISKRSRHRLKNLKVGDYIDVNPTMKDDKGWKCGKIKEFDRKSDQILVLYESNDEMFLYWTHLDNINEIAQFTKKSATHKGQCLQCNLNANGKCDDNALFYCCKCWVDYQSK